MIAKLLPYLIISLTWLVMANQALADGRTKAVKETIDYILQRFGRTAFREGAEVLARKVEVLASRHGDQFLKAIRQVGPRTLHLVEAAGEHANQAVRAMAQFGEHGATWIVARPKGMQMFLKYGEEAAATLVRHKGVAEPIIENLGRPALKALQVTTAQNARRLGMMVEGGELARIGRSHELLEVIGSYGDRAMTFVWEHKGALATTAGLTAFLANPETFINGAKDMAQIVGENAIKPVMQIPGAVATEVARGTNWTVIFLCAGLVGVLILAAKYFAFGKWRQVILQAGTADARGGKTTEKAATFISESLARQANVAQQKQPSTPGKGFLNGK